MGGKRFDWREEAACAGMGDLFFPEDISETRGRPRKYYHRELPESQRLINRAKQICEHCPVRRQCLAEGLAQTGANVWGIWGGLTANERRQLQKIGGGSVRIWR